MLKKVLKGCGLWMVYAGVVLLIGGFCFGWTNHNWYLPLPLIFIIAGVAGYVFRTKAAP
ncbi:MAG: hypothetical protein IKX36_03535 [Prevotella sp.]|nr:hypothetical protein [Prevotella sp.]